MTARRFVVDSSGLVKAVIDEAHSQEFRRWLTEMLEEGADLLAPHLLRYEFGNILASIAKTRPDWTPEIRARLLHAATLGFTFVDGEGTEQIAPPCTYYDASYVALAKAASAVLVTFDDEMRKTAKATGVECYSMSASQP